MPTTDDLIRTALRHRADTVDPDALRYSQMRHARSAGPRPRMLLAIAASIIVVAAIAVGAFALSGRNDASHPSGTARPQAESLYGVTWLDPESQDTVRFEPGTAHTDDGCLSETRTLTVSGHQFSRLGSQVGTMSTCGGAAPPPPGSPAYAQFEREQRAGARFFRVLDSAPSWSIRGRQLTLTSPTGETLALITPPVALPDTSWSLELVAMPGGPERAYRGPTLSFDDHGGFRATDGSGGVLTGTATIDRNRVTIANVHNTYRGLWSARLSRAIDAILYGRLGYQIKNNTLRLYQLNGDGTLWYKPAA